MKSYINKPFYTVSELGKIDVITIDNNNDSYTFTSKTLDYASDTEIANCTVPIEVLVDFLNISASTEFLSAFEELIKDQEIIIKLYDLTTTETVETHTEQVANPSADITANIVYEMDEGVMGPPPKEQIVQTENFDSVTITQDTTSTHISTNYELALEKANTWYVKMERKSQKTSTTSVDGPNDSTIPGYTIKGDGDSAFHDSRIDSNTQGVLSGNLDVNSLWRRIENRIPSRGGYHVVPGESSVTVDSTIVEFQDGTKTVTTTTTTETLSKGTMQNDDNTDAFLGLWKNEDGQYHPYADYDPNTGKITYNDEALFDPDGKKVGYHDLYGDDDANIGELFVNADEELFELLESSSSSDRTESYANIMRYILYRYTNKDYGITTFSQLLRLLGINVMSTGSDFNVNTSTAEGEEIMPTKDELKAALQSTPYWSVFEGDLDAIYNAQETYHVNGIFTAAVAIIESSAGTDMSGKYGHGSCSMFSILNGHSFRGYDQAGRNQEIKDFAELISGSLYFGDGRYTVSTIGERYCDADWVQKVRSIMADMFSAAGIEVSIGQGGTVVEKAIECHQYLRENGYTYGGGYMIPDGIYNSSKIVDCSAYVSWVLYCAGYDSFEGWQEISFRTHHHGFAEVPFSQVQPGDVLVYPGHVELAAQVENGRVVRVYNCGSTSSIQSAGTSEYPETSFAFRWDYVVILRAPGN